MKKISSVFVTAFVFLLGFVNSAFPASGSIQAEKLTNLEKDSLKNEDLGKFQNMETAVPDEKNIKINDLDNLKVQDLGKIENLEKSSTQTKPIKNIKLDSLEMKTKGAR